MDTPEEVKPCTYPACGADQPDYVPCKNCERWWPKEKEDKTMGGLPPMPRPKTCPKTDRLCSLDCEIDVCRVPVDATIVCPAKETKSRNPKDLASVDKVPMIVPPVGLIQTSRVMHSGSVKYGPANWRDEPIKASVYHNAMFRHFMRLLSGELIDQDSGLPHEAHIASNCMILMDARSQGVLTEDTFYASEDGGDIIEALLKEHMEKSK